MSYVQTLSFLDFFILKEHPQPFLMKISVGQGQWGKIVLFWEDSYQRQ